MDLMQAMRARHSVRQYTDEPLSEAEIQALEAEIDACNLEGGLHIQLVKDEPKAFDSKMAHYGRFSGVRNYLALVGPKSRDLEEKCGYYGERLVLEAQRMGLNTCWVYLTYAKIPDAFVVAPNEKLVIVIAIGHGLTPGSMRKTKNTEQIADLVEPTPMWYMKGIEAAKLAPTAMNQQKFHLCNDSNTVRIRPGFGICTKIDMGIVKYHFEIGAGKENFSWVE